MSLQAPAWRPKAERKCRVLAPNLYFDRGLDIDAAKILPGEYFVTERDMVLVTVLGSCVTACIRDKLSGIGGMNHFMLPDANPDKDAFGESARYGTFAMEILINSLLKLGAHRTLLEAKVFGGGNVLPGLTVANVGQRNADFVLRFLETEKIRVAAKDLVDVYPRKVYFFPKSGRVMVRKLRTIHNDTIFAREKDYGSRLQSSPIGGDIELFG
ncbi:MAG: chemoreceptor glutamine deamidase CheD [Dechloromonas sp.]|nr:chemoreceptor glutamine deamidase CheD [Dechloromonas sp.]